MTETQSELERIVASIQTSGALNVLLWFLSLVGGVVLIGWVLFAGPATEAGARAEAVGALWPVILAWTGGLALKSKITGDQKREVVRADTMLKQVTMSRQIDLAMAEKNTPPREGTDT